MLRIFIGSIVIAALVACGTNPVSGKRQVTLMSQAQEIELGSKQYLPSQQSQGGAYTVDKSLTSYVADIGRKLAKHSAQPDLPYEFVVLNNDVPNAWALPGGKIAFNTGLLVELEDEAQLAAVMGHEIVHAAARHGAEQMATATGINLLAVLAASQTDNNLYRGAIGLGAQGFTAKYGRDNELESDYYGINYMVAEGYDPQAAVELQQTFVRLRKASGAKSNAFQNLFASHPPSEERVRRNQERAAKLPKGKRNRAEYQAAIRQLKKDQPAYQKNREAIAAANKKEWDKALSLNQEAIKLQPKEARFHIIRGRLLSQGDNNKEALRALNTAVKLDSAYFQTYFYRGILNHRLKNYDKAKQDFNQSNKLLPTQQADYYLGDIAVQKNQYQLALGYFQRVQQSGGKLGAVASQRIQSLTGQR